jgi:hypothetical protein
MARGVLLIVFLGALHTAQNAVAFCFPIAHYIYVGNTTTDTGCDADDIPSAITAVVCPNTTVVVTSERSYTSQALMVTNKSFTLSGTTGACGAPISCDPTLGCGGGGGGPVILHGNGSSPVLFVYGNSSVTVENIELTGGGGSQGGGILFGGNGTLTLIDSTIISNTATDGGGIYAAGIGGTATVNLGAGTLIKQNTATADGGGIYLSGGTRLLALKPYTFIGYNHAPNGYGGGIMVAGPPPAQAEIGSPGYNGGPVIQFNDAAYGGGIAVVAHPPENYPKNVEARLFATDPNSPAAISSNNASQHGGGIYVKPGVDTSTNHSINAEFCAAGFRIDDNDAADGAAIYSDTIANTINQNVIHYGGEIYVNSTTCQDMNFSATLASLGAVDCAPGVTCNTINSNGSLDASNQPTSGATILMDTRSSFDIERFLMRLNYGGNAIRAVSAVNGQAVLSTCVIADNNETGELIRAENYFSEIYNCTIANNTIGGASVIYATVPAGNPGYDLRDSIVDQPGMVTRNAGSTFNGENILSTDGTFATTVGSPTFVNAAGGDYHLQLSSLGIDYAQTGATPSTVDLDGLSRIFDIPTIANYEGPIDLGAYERHPPCYRPDTLQCDGYDGVY